MKHEAFWNYSAQDLIDEIREKASDRSPCLASEILFEAAKELGGELAEIMSQIAHLKEQRAGWHPGESSEDARRRLQNPKLKTPYPADRAGALLLKRIELSEEITTLMAKVATPLAKLEMVDAELAAVRHSLEELERTRAVHKDTGLYAGSADFISRLHNRFEIGWAELACVTEEDEQEIANIVLRRVPGKLKTSPQG